VVGVFGSADCRAAANPSFPRRCLCFYARDMRVQLLSSDVLRKVITPEPTCSPEERDLVYSTLVYIAGLLADKGVNVIIDATGNFRRYREHARQRIPTFIEAYLRCPLEACMHREANRTKTYQAPTQIYARAAKGAASTVLGIGQPYEPPLNPEITVDTAKLTPEECAVQIMKKLLVFLGEDQRPKL
jgi:adenylylsulfate kinase